MIEVHTPFTADTHEEGIGVSGVIERDGRGAAVITSITVSCTTGHNMGQILRRLRLGEIVQMVATAPPPDSALREPSGPPSGGRQPLDDDLMRRVAVAYLRETAPGQPSGAMGRLASEFGRPEETVRSWIYRARVRGWLGPSRKGRRGAEPGPRFIVDGLQ